MLAAPNLEKLAYFGAINATLNAASGVLLVAAYLLIKRRHLNARNVRAHAWLMIAALVTSATFLAIYLYSHLRYGEKTSGLPPSAIRMAYFVMLASHVLLAIVVLPMVCITVWHAYHRRWEKHRRLARPTFWIWLYVSVTGVLVYLTLYHLFPALKQSA